MQKWYQPSNQLELQLQLQLVSSNLSVVYPWFCFTDLSYIHRYYRALFVFFPLFFFTDFFITVLGKIWMSKWGLADDTTVCVVNLEHVGPTLSCPK